MIDSMILSFLLKLITCMILLSRYSDLVNSPFNNSREEFCIILFFFPAVQGIICFMCLLQFRQASIEQLSTALSPYV